jgi:hypothetical protein
LTKRGGAGGGEGLLVLGLSILFAGGGVVAVTSMKIGTCMELCMLRGMATGALCMKGIMVAAGMPAYSHGPTVVVVGM